MNNLTEEVESLPAQYRRVIVGDFNLDLRLQRNQDIIGQYEMMNMKQKVEYTTHIYGGILDLIFDSKDTQGSADWMPTPFSDHFIIYYDM